VTKPFDSEELLARIGVALRRSEDSDGPEVERMTVADLIIDYKRRRVLRGGEEIRLTPREFDLLALLARNADRILTHGTIVRTIWGVSAAAQPEHLWTLMTQLRKKVEHDPSHPRYLLSEPFVGYRLATPPALT
jgi:two-component system KDP operon response regulator KdpE